MSDAASMLEMLRAALGSRADQLDIVHVPSTGSTNADLLEKAREAGAAMRAQLRVADRQTAGRGRLGRPWHGEPGASLAFSLAWPTRATTLAGLSLAIGVAAADALDPLPARRLRIGLKWPNDLWIVGDDEAAGRKLGGILVETTPAPGGRIVVVGVGLNILAQGVPGASSGVGWLREIDALATPSSALAKVAPALLDALARFDSEGFSPFAGRFATRDLLCGRAVRTQAPTGGLPLEGVACGISAEGELLLQTAQGMVGIASGEVSVRPIVGES
ncbi:MAG TPA: biotin--[acetyl-CoA-carboxylase] ligase, partial [Caldimonas sp.]|nr:biotin--[acetyl-CoA-carboxylase] ligase [Caldimonas sp.]